MNLKLEEIGLTKGEIKVYMALAESGVLTKSGLSVKSAVSSSKVYEIAEKLVKKGLIGTIKNNGKKSYQINNPEALMIFIEERERKIQEEKEIVRKAIPIIANMKNKRDNYRFEIFEGTAGLKQVLDETLGEMKNNEEICGFGIKMGDIGTLHKYHQKRTAKNIKQRFIFPNRELKWTIYKDKQYRILPEITNIGIGITGKKVILASLGKEPVTLITEHPHFNKSFKQIFEKLWEVAEK
jgi:sugar-specific transcriptional regulator TrmB